jgi:hypothetical protein
MINHLSTINKRVKWDYNCTLKFHAITKLYILLLQICEASPAVCCVNSSSQACSTNIYSELECYSRSMVIRISEESQPVYPGLISPVRSPSRCTQVSFPKMFQELLGPGPAGILVNSYRLIGLLVTCYFV